jgi:nitrate/TMAO reductase-like tetraheme cytochrome c subunit
MENTDELPCAQKLVFDTKKEAEAIALATDWQRGAALKAYKCRYCHLYHLTSQSTD